MESMFALDLAHSVLAAELDLAIIAEPSESPHLTVVQLASVPLCVAMQADHPAAKRRSVSIEEFGDVGWMIFPRKAHPAIYDRILDASRQAAISPVESHHYAAPQEAVQRITENFGIAFKAKGVAEQIRNPEIAVRPMSEVAPQITSYLVLRADQSSRLVNEFGRAFLRKVLPNSKIEDASGQLSLTHAAFGRLRRLFGGSNPSLATTITHLCISQLLALRSNQRLETTGDARRASTIPASSSTSWKTLCRLAGRIPCSWRGIQLFQPESIHG